MTPEEMQARVLYRDGLMLVIDKPAGLPVHRGPKGGASLEDFFDALRFGLPRPPALAHRLDKETSGCLVLGRHRKALAHLGLLFKHGKVGKTYWAVVEGGPDEHTGVIDLPLGRLDPSRGWWMKPDPDGQPAMTKWAVLGRTDANGISSPFDSLPPPQPSPASGGGSGAELRGRGRERSDGQDGTALTRPDVSVQRHWYDSGEDPQAEGHRLHSPSQHANALPPPPGREHLRGRVWEGGLSTASQTAELNQYPPPGELRSPTSPSRGEVKDFTALPSGDPREGASRLTWLALEPLTGRTHQLRVHCAAMGWPIVGDNIYGNAPRFGGPGLHLHARELVVPISRNKEPARIIAPVPEHMHELLRACGLVEETEFMP